MSKEEFSLEAAEEKALENVSQRRCADACPLAQIPAAIWKNLLRPPFRKRHPVIFWIILSLFFFIAIAITRWLFSERDLMEGTDRIALVSVRGTITDVQPTLEWLRRVESNHSVKGILLRVDSPGGGAAASQEIYSALARVGRKIPIAVSMGSTAASGGLMVSMAGERIFANPSTVTGSIGVRMDIPQLQGLMDKIGVGQETLVTAPFKDAASYLHPLSAADRAYLQAVIGNMHDQFVEIVAKGRKMPKEQAEKLATGKIFTGQEALGLGLIDALGGQDDALAWLSEKTGVPRSRKLLTRPPERARALERLLGLGKILGLDLSFLEDFSGMSRNLARPAFLYQLW